MASLNISVPIDLQSWMETRIADGAYVDAGDYLRDLIERDRDDHAAEVRRVQRLIDEGIASGIVDREPEELLNEIVADMLARRG